MLTNDFPIIQKLNNLYEQGEYKEGGGKCRELTLCLRIDTLWSMGIVGNPMPELNLTPPHNWL
jgi:hypothetical protein